MLDASLDPCNKQIFLLTLTRINIYFNKSIVRLWQLTRKLILSNLTLL